MKAAFTIITADYISYAKTLGDSIIKYNSGYEFYVCLIGKKTDLHPHVDKDNMKIIESELLIDQLTVLDMQKRYTAFELSCALKPFFAEYLLKNTGTTRLKYIDSDIMLFESFDKQIEENTTASIFLTPHFFIPVDPTEENTTNDILLIKSGIFNAGYFELANTKVSFDFLTWWKDRLSKYCYYYKPPFPQVFVDQSWLNFVPIYFKEAMIIDNLGYNASFFNLHERRLSMRNGRYWINNDQPLVFFHFTGYRYLEHEKASVHNNKYNYENTPLLEPLCSEYRDALIANGIELTVTKSMTNGLNRRGLSRILIRSVNGLLENLLGMKLVKTDS
jgi:hypothetical protein